MFVAAKQLIKNVGRHHEPVGTFEFRMFAILLFLTAVGIACASSYAYVTQNVEVCLSTAACDAPEKPGSLSPLQKPFGRDVVPARIGSERRSGRRS